MSNGAESPSELAEFLDEADLLFAKSQDCLDHLALIANDEDAISRLLTTLLDLSQQAQSLAIRAIASFTRQIHALLDQPMAQLNLHTDALLALRNCFTLLSWQLELVDRTTGQLPLDDEEQSTVLGALASQLVPASACTCRSPAETTVAEHPLNT